MSGGHALAELRRLRRRRRLADVHWIDALYRAYLTALLGGFAVLLAANAVGDRPVRGAALADVRADGPAYLGIVVAGVLAVGLRSGGRGGPLALERPEVRHVLLAPVDRARALRGPALRQVRFALFVAAVTGAVAGHLAGQRLPGTELGWTLAGAAFGATAVAGAYGAALVVSGLRLRSWMATLALVVSLGWAVTDLAVEGAPAAPTSYAGLLALWPLDVDLLALVPAGAAVVALVVGVLLLGGTSIESAERRSVLVGQLRFAATLQDVRTVIVLRRQLAMELPRTRPWFRLPARGRDRLPVWTRGWRGLLRWPLARVGRAVILAAVAGLAARGAYDGTTPLLVVSGLALFVAALDAVEPLAQEIDHPTRVEGLPLPAGALHVRQVPAATVAMIVVAEVAAAVAVITGLDRDVAGAAFLVALFAALGATAGAALSVVMGAPTAPPDAALVAPPEAAGMALAVRAAWPPAVAVLGAVPIVEPGVAPIVVAVFVLVCMWLRVREQVHGWWAEQLEAMGQGGSRPSAEASDG